MPVPAEFRWSIPERFNIGADVAERHAAKGNDTALIEVDASGKVTTFGFRDVVRLANRLAHLLPASGIEPRHPKGALHAHRVLVGHLPGVEYPHDGFPQPGDRFWTPADWAWIGGLYDVLLPAWHHGVAVVAYRARKFVPAEALDLMSRQGVRNVFMPPTALKLLRASGARNPGVRLRSLASGGESLGEGIPQGGREEFGLPLNQIYRQTQGNPGPGHRRRPPPP